MLIYLENNIIVIFQVQKNTESNTPNIARKKTQKNNTFVKMTSV